MLSIRHFPRGLALICAFFSLTVAGGWAQTSAPANQGATDAPRHYGRMSMLLEKTIFKVDVLVLEVELSDSDARDIARVVERGAGSIEDSIAAIAINTRAANLRTQFLRSISLDQFVDGARRDLQAVLAAGVITDETHRVLFEGLPVWFGFLEERRIQKGDELQYRISGDTLRTSYGAADGTTLMQRTDVDADRSRAVLGTYFVRGSQFRDKLIESLPKSNSE